MSLLMPKRWKYRKQMRWRIKWVSKALHEVSFWDYWLKAMENGYITNRQLEAARRVIVRRNRKTGKIWTRVFPDIPYTKKWLEMPMGKWKWWVDHYVARVKRWAILMELSGLSREDAEEVIKQAWYKFPIKIRLVARNEIK